MPISRRRVMQFAVASALTGTSLSRRAGMLSAHAADTSGYKALVCVFLFGGLDGHDLLIPYDLASYNSYANIRQTLLNDYGEARSRESLLALSPDNASSFGSREFALPPETPQLHALFEQGRAAIVANVGPLIEPVTAEAFANGAASVPSRLFSHNDQQSTWQASAPEGAQLGWGGLFADAAIAAGANASNTQFTTLAAAGVGPFLTGNIASPYQLTLGGSSGIAALNELSRARYGNQFASFVDAAQNSFRADGFTGNNVLARDLAASFRDSIDANLTFDAAREQAVPLMTEFPDSSLGAQLRTVAETMSIRSSLLASRQIFFVGTGGFDTHSSQAVDLPALLSQLDGALAAFDTAMIELGLSQDVTTFTASDFGRTLAVNGDGTDHGWGAHHLVVGGAVKGGQILGDVPEPRFDHELDAGGGRLIPSLAVEQLADPMGRWWGLSDSEVAMALPNLGNFDPAGLNLFV